MPALLLPDTEPAPTVRTARQRPVTVPYRPLHTRRRRRYRALEIGLLLACVAIALVILGLLAGWQAPARVVGIDSTPPEVVTTTTTTAQGRAVTAGTAPARGVDAPTPRATVPPTGPAPTPGGVADPSASGSAGAPVGAEARPTVGAPTPAAAVPATTVTTSAPATPATTAPRTASTVPHVPVTASTTTLPEPPPEPQP